MSWSPCYCRTNKIISNSTNELTFYSYNNMFKVCCVRLYNQTLTGYRTYGNCDFHCRYYYQYLNYDDFKSIVYNNEIIIVHKTARIKESDHTTGGYRTIIKVKNIKIDDDIIDEDIIDGGNIDDGIILNKLTNNTKKQLMIKDNIINKLKSKLKHMI